MTEADVQLVEWLEQAGWLCCDVRYSTTGSIESVGSLIDPETGAVFLSVLTAARTQAQRGGEPAPVPLALPVPKTLPKSPIIPVEQPEPTVLPSVQQAEAVAAKIKSRPKADIYQEKIEPLLAQLDKLCASVGVSGFVLVEADEDPDDGSVAVLSTTLGPRPLTEFLRATIKEAQRDEDQRA